MTQPVGNLYGRRWRLARAAYLREHHLCVECQKRGVVRAATVVDHVVAHRGDPVLFFDPGNRQSLCKRCHDVFKQSLEKGGQGFDRGCDVSGHPADPKSPWNEPSKT